MTVIEKFEHYAAQMGFAVTLMTADDLGPAAGSDEELPRARQNVPLELGYFIAALGRSNVGVLHADGVEIPSDITGVLWTKLDANGDGK